MKLTQNDEHEIERLRKILSPEQMEAIEEEVENEKAVVRYRQLLENASDR